MQAFKKIALCAFIFFGLTGQTPSTHDFQNLTVVEHPLIKHKLTIMRNKKTKSRAFSRLLHEISLLMTYEVTRNLPTKDLLVETPVAQAVGSKLSGRIVIVPILRAGLGMSKGLEEIMPHAKRGHIGLARDPITKQPIEYLFKIPKNKEGQIYIVVDPMLATGGSAVYAVKKMIDSGIAPTQIIFMSLVAAPEGVEKFQEQLPTVPIFTAALDEKLNEKAYIVPGLGDAGDRVFGTE
ncbi:MAG: uracil phosphoribosyltransferase [Alphaproteobacteria bacterium]|nr:MAG: uracil phosphoribosyltransferase [Alphaproteobacteria bacterium]